MSSDQPFTPSEDDLIRAWKAYRDAADAADAWVREDDAEPAEDEARRFLTRARRDAALHEKQRIAGEVRLWASVNDDLKNPRQAHLLRSVAGDIDRIPEGETP